MGASCTLFIILINSTSIVKSEIKLVFDPTD